MLNEYPGVVDVINSLTQVSEISEVICVDDGSEDLRASNSIRKKYSSVKLMRHTRNLGKKDAIKTGFETSTRENLILIDSDLQNVKADEIIAAIKAFEKNKLDCLLVCTLPVTLWDLLARIIIGLPHAATGSRILKRSILEKVLNDENVKGYQLEPAINRYIYDKNLKVAHFNISAKNTHKTTKIGFLKGVKQEIIMWTQFIKYSDVFFNLYQALFFGKKRV